MWWHSLMAGPSFRSIHSCTVGRFSSSSACPSISWSKKILARGAQSVVLMKRTTSVTLHSRGLVSKHSFWGGSAFGVFGEGGRFSSSENEGERGFRRLRVGLGVAGGEGDGVVGWDFPTDCSESSWRSSCISEPESSLRESSSSKSSSSPLPCGEPAGVLSTEADERLFLWTKSCFLLFLLRPLLFTPASRLVWPPGGRPTRLLFFFP